MAGLTPYEIVSQRLLRGIPKPRRFGKLVCGRWLTGTRSLHRTPQGVKFNRFWRLKYNRRILVDKYSHKSYKYEQ